MGRRFRPLMKRSLAEIYAAAADIAAVPTLEDAIEENKVREGDHHSARQLGQMGRSSRPIMMRSLVKINVAALDVVAAPTVVDGNEESKASRGGEHYLEEGDLGKAGSVDA